MSKLFCKHSNTVLRLTDQRYGVVVECRCADKRCNHLIEWAYRWETNKRIVREYDVQEKEVIAENDEKFHYCK